MNKQEGKPPCDKARLNPINSATGNKYQREMDYEAATGGLSFVRSYNSASNESGVMGYGWRHHWQARLKRYDHATYGSRIVATRLDGQSYYFTLSGGQWVNEADITARLTESGGSYVLIDGASTRETYNSVGQLLFVQSAGDESFTLSYSGNLLSSITDQFGRSLNLAYNTQGRLSTVTDPANKVTSYAYSGAGNLTSVTYPDNRSRIYHYENANFPHALTGITDENGNRYATWGYDSQGRATSGTHAGGADSGTLTYNADGSTTFTDALGLTSTQNFTLLHGVHKTTSVTQPCGNCGGSTASTTYNANGFVASRTDFNGHVTSYTHDSRGLETSRTEAIGSPEARTITTSWHASFRLPLEVNEPGRKTEYTYDANGNRLTQTITDTATNESRTTTYTYTAQGLLDTINGPRTDVTDITDFDYNAQGNLISITNALNQVTQITSHDAHGNPLTIINPDGVTTTLSYDDRQRLLSRIVSGVTTSFIYDDAGNLTRLTLPTGTYLSYTYDAAHRLTDIRDNLANRIHYLLDNAGNRTREDVYDPSGVLKRRLRQEYDSQSRLKKILGANGQATEFGYDDQGNRISATEANTYLTSTEYDALDRVLRVTDAANGITEYSYNSLNQLQTVKDPKGLSTGYTVNAFGEVISQTSPDTGVTSYTYDKAGNRTSQTDARTVTVSYSYDALGRLTLQDYSGTSEDVTYFYDGTNYGAASADGIGRLTGIQDPSGSSTYLYHPRGTLRQESRTIQGQVYVTQYVYDAADRLVTLVYPSGRTVDYTRNALGQVTGVSTTLSGVTTTLASGIEYLPFGPSRGMTLGNGLVDTRDYDLDYRVSSIASAALDLSYAYDIRNNITGITNNLDVARSQTFTGYDALSRLTAATGDYGALSYTYDSVGNRLSETDDGVTTAYNYDSQSHRLLTAGATAFAYDPAGNVTQKGGQQLQYNTANRLSSVRQQGLELLGNLYNAAGQRVMKTSSGQATVYHYGQDGELLAESDTSAVVQLERVYLEGLPLAQFTPADPVPVGPILETLPVPLPIPVEDPVEPVIPLLRPTPLYTPAESVRQCLPRRGLAFRFGTFLPCTWSRYNRYYRFLPAPLPVAPPVVQPPLLPPPPPVPPVVPPTPATPPEANGPKAAYFLLDHLGTPQRLTDKSQAIIWDASYEPFGEVSFNKNRIEQALRFPGHYADSETGLHDNWWRQYDPGTGRYPQGDRIGLAGGLSTYGYANQNPLRFVDTDGQIAFVPFLLMAWAGVEVGLSAADAVSTGTTLIDPCATTGEKAFSAGLFVLGAGLPGGGYSTAAKSAGQLGRKGESAIHTATGVAKNTKSFVVNGRTRIPDFVTARDPAGFPTGLIESKNVQYQSLTRQLRDYRDLVGSGGRVDVALPPGARVSRPLQDAFDNPNNPLFRMYLP